ncbi:MAG: hypothetical protein ABL927_03115, partial [Bdellovibrionales bacterium]
CPRNRAGGGKQVMTEIESTEAERKNRKLREGLVWSDGVKLTAEDFVALRGAIPLVEIRV